MSLEEESKTKMKVSTARLKHQFAERFPDSPIIQILLSMPDEMPADELIGAVAVILDLFDTESHNNLPFQSREEVMK